MSKRDVLLVINSFRKVNSLANNAKIRSSLKFLLIWYDDLNCLMGFCIIWIQGSAGPNSQLNYSFLFKQFKSLSSRGHEVANSFHENIWPSYNLTFSWFWLGVVYVWEACGTASRSEGWRGRLILLVLMGGSVASWFGNLLWILPKREIDGMHTIFKEHESNLSIFLESISNNKNF